MSESKIDVQPSDIIKVVEQFLKESSLYKTLEVLQEETSVKLNTVDSIEQLTNDINSGNWDAVLKTTRLLKLSDEKLIELYQHIVLELIELKEAKAATWLLHRTEPMLKLKISNPDRHAYIQSLVNRTFFDYREVYSDGTTKERKRAAIAESLKKEVEVVPPQRLLSLICDALKWQKNEGMLPTGSVIDVFTGKTHIARSDEETYPTILHKHCIKPLSFNDEDGKKNIPIFVCCASFTPDGQFLVVGYSTGLVEVRNSTNGKLAQNLKYQAQKNFIVTPSVTAVLCINFSLSEMVAIGDKSGDVSIWKLQTGQLLQVFKSIHEKGVNCVIFCGSNREILTGGHDTTVKLSGLRNNRVKKIYAKHTACVNAVAINKDDTHFVSGSNDCSVKIWNAKSATVLCTYQSTAKIHTVLLLPHFKSDIFLIGDRSNKINFIDIDAKIRVKLVAEDISNNSIENNDKKSDTAKSTISLNACCSSPKGNWIYATDSHNIYCFNYSAKSVQHILKMHEDSDNTCIGVFHHPMMNSLASYDLKGNLKLWRP